MTRILNILYGATFSLLTLLADVCLGQYPDISPEVAAESKKRMDAIQEHSDAAWQKALPTIRQWEAKDKPYIPWAKTPSDLPQASIPAFPGAQGGGMYSFGGRGGKVYVVTNLNDRGPGSFRDALEAGGPRFVVFNVAGIIKLKERILVRAPLPYHRWQPRTGRWSMHRRRHC